MAIDSRIYKYVETTCVYENATLTVPKAPKTESTEGFIDIEHCLSITIGFRWTITVNSGNFTDTTVRLLVGPSIDKTTKPYTIQLCNNEIISITENGKLYCYPVSLPLCRYLYYYMEWETSPAPVGDDSLKLQIYIMREKAR